MILLRRRHIFALSLLIISCTTRPMLRTAARFASTRILPAALRSASTKPKIIIDSIEHLETELPSAQTPPIIAVALSNAVQNGNLHAVCHILSRSSTPANDAQSIYNVAREKYIAHREILDILYGMINHRENK